MLDKEAVRDLAARYAEAARKIVDPDAVLLFGSHAGGNPTEYSDIDVAFVCNGFEGDWYETTIALARLAREFSFDIEPHLLDETRDESGFAEQVLKTGEIIFRRGQR